MKIKVSKKQLKESIRAAVTRCLNEAIQAKAIKESWDDDDDDDPVSRFLKNPKNQLPRRMKGSAAAKKAAMADIKKETDSEKHDEDAVEKREKADAAENED